MSGRAVSFAVWPVFALLARNCPKFFQQRRLETVTVSFVGSGELRKTFRGFTRRRYTFGCKANCSGWLQIIFHLLEILTCAEISTHRHFRFSPPFRVTRCINQKSPNRPLKLDQISPNGETILTNFNKKSPKSFEHFKKFMKASKF